MNSIKRLQEFAVRENPQASYLECIIVNYFSYFSSKSYVVGTQKNHLNEMVLLGTQNISLN